MLENSSAERQDRLSYCLFTWQDAANVDALTLKLPGGETILPVFDLEARAGMFLWLEALDEGWQVKKLSVADLVSLLCGPCASIERVLLNPFSAGDEEEAGVKREAFLRTLAGERACSIKSVSMVGSQPNVGSAERGRP